MKLAFVLPWYDRKGIPGGAEAEARRTIDHLMAAGYTVEVFTTCIKDFFADWSKNDHRAGTREESGIIVHRFPVLKRNTACFEKVNQKIIGRSQLTNDELLTFADQFIRSPELLKAIYRNRDSYLFFFIPYLFPTTFNGLPLVGENSVLIPCLHDEGYAYLDLFKQVIPKAGAAVYHTHSEAQLARSIYAQPADQIGIVLGEGVDDQLPGDGTAFRKKFDIKSPFILFAGRKDPGKNLGQLFYYFEHYLETGGYWNDLKIVLIGPGTAPIPSHMRDRVLDLGYVSAADKRNGFAAASLFCHPSLNESFSIVLMESWLAEKPALVNRFNPVLVEHIQRSSGGLYYGNHEEFIGMVDWILDHEEEAAAMGKNGRKYVETNFAWDKIIAGYIDLIEQMAGRLGRQIVRRTA